MVYHTYLSGPHPTDNLVSAPVFAFSPFKVGFLHNVRVSKLPRAASVKSAPSTSESSKFVPVNTALLKMAPLREDPWNVALSTMAFEKSAPSNLESRKV